MNSTFYDDDSGGDRGGFNKDVDGNGFYQPEPGEGNGE